jgi:hypothetical protein
MLSRAKHLDKQIPRPPASGGQARNDKKPEDIEASVVALPPE